MTNYGSRDPRRFLDDWLDRLLWQLGIVRRGRFTRLAAAYDDVFGWWAKAMRADLNMEKSIETIEDDLFLPDAFTRPIRGDTPKTTEGG